MVTRFQRGSGKDKARTGEGMTPRCQGMRRRSSLA